MAGGVENRGELLLAFADLHLGDRNQLLRSLMQALVKAITLVRENPPRRIQLLVNGDAVAGRGVFRGQDVQNVLQLGEEQVLVASWVLRWFVTKLAEAAGIPTEEIELSLTSYGWYYTLAFERWVNYATGPADTGAQIRAICAASTYVATTALTCPDTGFSIDQERPTENLTGQAEVERLAALGDSAGNGLWFQPWDDRIGYLTRYGGGDFPAIDYYADRRGLYDRTFARIPSYLARADRVMKTNRFLPGGYGVYSDPLDTPAAVYVLETEYRVGQGLLVKPAGWKDFADLIAGL